MGKRYGRNQKRASRERIAQLEAQLAEARRMLSDSKRLLDREAGRALAAEAAARCGVEEAFRLFTQHHRLLTIITTRLAEHVAAQMTPRLKQAAEELLAHQRQPPQLYMSVQPDRANFEVYRLHLTIPQFDAAYYVTGAELRQSVL